MKHKLQQQPSDRHLEQCVLGGIVLVDGAIKDAFGVEEECFYHDDHKIIFNACEWLHRNERPIDPVTVIERLKSTGELMAAGGPAYVAELTNMVASSANIEYHTRLLIQYATRRKLIQASGKVMAMAYDDKSDPLELVEVAEKQIFQIGSSFHKKKFYDSAKVGKMVLDHFESTRSLKGDQTTGIPSGIIGLDRLMNGLQRGDLGIIAARPGMGKTALVLNNAQHMAMVENIPGVVFSLEMTAIQLGQRMIAIDSGINTEVLRDGRKATKYDVEAVTSSAGRFSNAPIWIDDTPGPTIHEIRSKARLLKAKYNIQWIIIDYLQLMSRSNFVMNDDAAIGEMSRGLKEMAKELDLPVIALSQLNRAVESRVNKVPNLSDLRSSGNIEQDADWIGFLFRPEYYNITVDEDQNEIPEGTTYLVIAKNRHGELRNVRLKFIGSTFKFTEPSDEDFPNEGDEPPNSVPSGNDDLPF